MAQLTELFSRSFMEISLGQVFGAFLVILAGFLAKRIITTVLRKISKAASITKTTLDDMVVEAIAPPIGWALGLGGIFVALQILPLPNEPLDIRYFVVALIRGTSIMLAIWLGVRLSDGLFSYWLDRAKGTESKLDDQFIPVLRRSLKVTLWVVGLTLLLQNLGYSVLSLVTGLGIGGAATP